MNKPVIKIKRTTNSNRDFHFLISKLNNELNILHNNQRQVYDQYNKVDFIETIVIAYFENSPVGCGCFKPFNKNTAEIKRMYVDHQFRGKGISKLILKELEIWAKELGYLKTILETGIKLPTAMALYQKNGYSVIENYGAYKDLPESICFEKLLEQ